jgi:hypothetical protein
MLKSIGLYVGFQDHERAFFDSADWALGKVCLHFSVDSMFSQTAVNSSC